MGLFDFVRGIGKKLFNRDEEAFSGLGRGGNAGGLGLHPEVTQHIKEAVGLRSA